MARYGWRRHFEALGADGQKNFYELDPEVRAEYIKGWARAEMEFVAESLSDTMNCCDKEDVAALIEHLTKRTHRYLQNELFFQFVVPLIKEWAKDYEEDRYDARNQYALKSCATFCRYSQNKA